MSAVLDRVREKYPVYKEVPDAKLARALAEKYPVYLEQDAHLKAIAEADPEPDKHYTITEPDRSMPSIKDTTKGGPPAVLRSGAAGDILENADLEWWTTPLVEIGQQKAPEEMADQFGLEDKGSKIAAGVNNSLANAANFFTSPLGLATLGVGALPAAAQRVIAGAFAVHMASQTPALARELGTEFGKPEAERDLELVAERITDTALNTAFVTLGGKHALTSDKTRLVKEVAGMLRKSEVRSPKSEIKGQKSEAAGQGWRPEISAENADFYRKALTDSIWLRQVAEQRTKERTTRAQPAQEQVVGVDKLTEPKPGDMDYGAGGALVDYNLPLPAERLPQAVSDRGEIPAARPEAGSLREAPKAETAEKDVSADPAPVGAQDPFYPAPAAPTPPTPPPAPKPGVTMIQGAKLPVTLDQTGTQTTTIKRIMDSLVAVQRAAGSDAGVIRRGRFSHKALGIFKSRPEVIRMKSIDDIPTATHEVGHALQKQLYGTVMSAGLKGLPPALKRELVGLGKALYGNRKPVAGYRSEGFSEFMRYWLTTDDAAAVAPGMTKFWEEQVLPKYPEVARELAAARKEIDIWRSQGSEQRALAQLTREPGTIRRIFNDLKKLATYQAQVESGAPLERISREASRKRGRPLRPSEDPFQIYSWKRGTAGGVVERMASENMLDVWGNPVGPPLKEALAPVKNQRKEFLLYLFARRAVERWGKNQNPGIALEDAQLLKSRYDSPEFQLAAKRYYHWWDQMLDYVAQADPGMADMVARIRQGSEDYAPLARAIDPEQARRAAAMAKSNPLRAMHGSGLPVKDIFDQTFINAARLVNQAHRAMVMRSVIKLANMEGLGHIVEEVPLDRVRQRVNVEQIRREMESMGVDTSNIPQDTLLEYYTPASVPKGTDPIVPYRNAAGETKWYQVDPGVFEVLDTLQLYSLKTAFPGLTGVGVALDLVLGMPARAFRLGTTGLRPTFSIITNPLRDVQALFMQTSSNPMRAAAEYPAAVRDVIREGLGGKEEGHVKAFYDLGANMAQPLGIDLAHTRRVSNEMFHGRMMRVVKNPVDHLRQLLSVPEAAPRIAELRAVAKDIGWEPGRPMTPDQAVDLALAAKRVTVDFTAMGDVGRIMNQAIPFYNAAIQGVRIFGRSMRRHPVRNTLMGLALFTAPTLLNWWRNKDEEWYQALPWRERYLYSNIDDGQNVWRIPRPFEWGNLFMVLPEAIMDSAYRQDPQAVRKAMSHIMETTNPLDWPVAVRTAKEQWQNHIEFWDRPIVPRGEEDLPAGQQIGPYTTRLARAVGAVFPEISPRRVDAALNAYFGGAQRDLLQLLGLGSPPKERRPGMESIPIASALVRSGGHFSAANRHVAEFYDLWGPINARVMGERRVLNRQAQGQATNPLRPVSPGERAAAKVGARTKRDVSLLIELAHQTSDLDRRQALYRQAGEIAKRDTEIMRNLMK